MPINLLVCIGVRPVFGKEARPLTRLRMNPYFLARDTRVTGGEDLMPRILISYGNDRGDVSSLLMGHKPHVFLSPVRVRRCCEPDEVSVEVGTRLLAGPPIGP